MGSEDATALRRRTQVPGGLNGAGSGVVVSGFVADADDMAEGFAKLLTATIDVVASVALGATLAALIAPGAGAVIVLGAAADRAVLVVTHDPAVLTQVDEAVPLDAGRLATPAGAGTADPTPR